MRISKSLIIFILTVAFCFFYVYSAKAQRVNINDYNSISAGIKFGFMPFYGDVRQAKYSTDNKYKSNNTAIAIEGIKNFNEIFGAKVQIMLASIKGSSPNLDMHFKNNMKEYSVSGIVNFNSLLDIYPKNERIINTYAFAGIGFSSFRTKLSSYNDNTFINAYGWDSLGLSKTKSVKAANFPIGFGFKVKADPKIDIGLEFTLHLTNTDKIDGYVVNKSYMDRFSYAAISVLYKIGKKAEYVEWINPFKTDIIYSLTEIKPENSVVNTNNDSVETVSKPAKMLTIEENSPNKVNYNDSIKQYTEKYNLLLLKSQKDSVLAADKYNLLFDSLKTVITEQLKVLALYKDSTEKAKQEILNFSKSEQKQITSKEVALKNKVTSVKNINNDSIANVKKLKSKSDSIANAKKIKIKSDSLTAVKTKLKTDSIAYAKKLKLKFDSIANAKKIKIKSDSLTAVKTKLKTDSIAYAKKLKLKSGSIANAKKIKIKSDSLAAVKTKLKTDSIAYAKKLKLKSDSIANAKKIKIKTDSLAAVKTKLKTDSIAYAKKLKFRSDSIANIEKQNAIKVSQQTKATEVNDTAYYVTDDSELLNSINKYFANQDDTVKNEVEAKTEKVITVPENKVEIKEVIAETKVEVIDTPAVEVKIIEKPEVKVETKTEVKTTDNTTKTQAQNSSVKSVTDSVVIKKFYILANLQESKKDAKIALEKLVKKGYPDAEIVGKSSTGKYRICYKGFATKEEATAALKDIKKINSSAKIFENK